MPDNEGLEGHGARARGKQNAVGGDIVATDSPGDGIEVPGSDEALEAAVPAIPAVAWPRAMALVTKVAHHNIEVDLLDCSLSCHFTYWAFFCLSWSTSLLPGMKTDRRFSAASNSLSSATLRPWQLLVSAPSAAALAPTIPGGLLHAGSWQEDTSPACSMKEELEGCVKIEIEGTLKLKAEKPLLVD